MVILKRSSHLGISPRCSSKKVPQFELGSHTVKGRVTFAIEVYEYPSHSSFAKRMVILNTHVIGTTYTLGSRVATRKLMVRITTTFKAEKPLRAQRNISPNPTSYLSL